MNSAQKGPDSCLRLFREHLGHSQQVMAEILGLNARTYAHYEQKLNARIPIEVLQHLAGMGLNLHWLFTGQGEMKRGSGINPLLPQKKSLEDKAQEPAFVQESRPEYNAALNALSIEERVSSLERRVQSFQSLLRTWLERST